MPDTEHDTEDAPDDSDKHPLTQVRSPLKDEDDKREDGDDDAWVPPVP
jgi:hypothetical protein